MYRLAASRFALLTLTVSLLGACIEAQPFEATEDDVVEDSGTPDVTETDGTETDTGTPDVAVPDTTTPDITDPDTANPDANTDADAEPVDATDAGPGDAIAPDAMADTSTDAKTDAKCVPDCEGKECGDDGCGGSCGKCDLDQPCTDGVCEDPCVPDCDGKECGEDGCGGNCGTCPDDLPICSLSGFCEEQCIPLCEENDWNCGDDGCGGICGGGSTPEGCYNSKPYCNAMQQCQKACPEKCPESCTEDGEKCTAQVTFQFDASCNPGSLDEIQHVWVVGSFHAEGDNWIDAPDEEVYVNVLNELPSGIHSLITWLPEGEYAYKFVTSNTALNAQSGTWEELSSELQCVATSGGYTNRVLSIEGADPIMLPVVSKNSCEACNVCTPDCDNKECGDDGCGGSCGWCAGGEQCDDTTFTCGLQTCANSSQCDDGDPCTTDLCEAGLCLFDKKAEGSPCWVNQWCNQDGGCQGDVLTWGEYPTAQVQRLSGKWHHNCMIHISNANQQTGVVRCWGRNTHGQLGIGNSQPVGDQETDMGDALSPVSLEGFVMSVTTGYLHSCAILHGGQVKCWGHDATGALGQASYIGNIGDTVGEMQDLDPIDLGNDSNGNERSGLQVAAGSGFTCVLLSDRQVKCFGSNDKGQLGNGTTDNSGYIPGENMPTGDGIPNVLDSNGDPLTHIHAIAAGESHACAIDQDGGAYCWGNNQSGQLGVGLEDTYLTKAEKVQLTDQHIYQLYLAKGHSCALLPGGQVKCWGFGADGALGYGSTTGFGLSVEDMMILPPLDLGANEDGVPHSAERLITGPERHTCAVLVGGSLKCWGLNAGGVLGLGLPAGQKIGDGNDEMGDWLLTVDLGTDLQVLEVTGGEKHNCALLEDASTNLGIKCWGYNGSDDKKGATGQPANWTLGTSPAHMGDNLPWVDLGINSAKWNNGDAASAP